MRRIMLLTATITMGCGGGGGGGPSGPDPVQTGTVAGTAVDEANAGVAGVSVQLSRTGQTTLTATTSAAGSYTFNAVQTGSWNLTATAPAGFTAQGSLTATVQVTAGGTTTVPPLQLARTTDPGEVSIIAMTDNAFSPNSLTVPAGRTVRWVNNGSTFHNSVSATSAWSSGDLAPGSNFERTFSQAGTFNYSCTLHPGMNGTVIVQ